MTFGGFFVSGVEFLGEFFRLASELHNVLGPFFRVFSTAQASSLTDPMSRRVSRASFASSQVASSSRLERMPEPVAPMMSWHQVILLDSSPTSPS